MRDVLRLLYLRLDSQPAQWWMRPLNVLIHAGVALFQQARQDKLGVRAAMLSYWTLVAVVPLLLLAFTLTSAAGLADSAVRHLFYDSLLANNIAGVGTQIDAMLDKASLRALGVVGVIGILLIGAQLYFQTEQAFNDIFYCKPKQSIISRFFGFYASITLGPLILAGGFVVTNQVSAEVPTVLNRLMSYLLPSLMTAVGLVGLIRFLPSTRVSWRAALWGGLTSAFLFEAAKRVFALYARLFGTDDGMILLYGSLALLPVFLIWLNVLWTIVLLGVEIAYIRQHWEQLVEQQHRWVMDPHADERHPDAYFGLAVMSVICHRFLEGQGASTDDDIAEWLGADARMVNLALTILEEADLIVVTESDRRLPSVPLDTTPTREILSRWRRITSPQTLGSFPGLALIHGSQQRADAYLDAPLTETMRAPPLQPLLPKALSAES